MTATPKKSWKKTLLRGLCDSNMIRKGDARVGSRSIRKSLLDAKLDAVLYVFADGAQKHKEVASMAREFGLHCFSYKHLGSSIVFASRNEDRIGEISEFLITAEIALAQQSATL